MAGDWIAISKALPRKAEVVRILSALNADKCPHSVRTRQEVVGWLVEFWAWLDDETTDGRVPVPIEMLPVVVGADLAFWRAVVNSGWLVADDNGLLVPNFGRWMGQSAKRRLQEAERKRAVRKMSASDADKKRLEERRGESNTPLTPQGGNSEHPAGRRLTRKQLAEIQRQREEAERQERLRRQRERAEEDARLAVSPDTLPSLGQEARKHAAAAD